MATFQKTILYTASLTFKQEIHIVCHPNNNLCKETDHMKLIQQSEPESTTPECSSHDTYVRCLEGAKHNC